jgi:uncharacterized protein YcbX
MTGETLSALELDHRGCEGDRAWSVRTAEGAIGSGKTSRRFSAVPGLLQLRASRREGRVLVEAPDGSAWDVEDPAASEALSRYVGRPVTLAHESDVSHFDDGPVSLLGSASLARVSEELGYEAEAAHFRPNVVVATSVPFVEDEWVGKELRIGAAVLRVVLRSTRCVMVDMATVDLPEAPGTLRAVGKIHETCLGVVAEVRVPGRIAAGDRVEVRG